MTKSGDKPLAQALQGKKVAVIGIGMMGKALLDGLVKKAETNMGNLIVSRRNKQKLQELASLLGVHPAKNNREAVRQADIVILAVRPENLDEVLKETQAEIDDSKLLISIVGGRQTESIEQRLPENSRVIRAMPNTCVRVSEGATTLCKGKWAEEEDIDVAKAIFDVLGETYILEENLMDAATAICGCGPAFILLVIEALSDGGVKVGLPRDISLRLAVQATLGAAKLMKESTNKHPAELKAEIMTPGGITAVGIAVLEERAVRSALIEAVQKATDRFKQK